MPVAESFFAGLPREKCLAVIDDGRKTNPPGRRVQEHDRQAGQLGQSFFKVSFGAGDFLADLVTTAALRPIQSTAFAIEAVLFGPELGQPGSIGEHIAYDALYQREHPSRGGEVE